MKVFFIDNHIIGRRSTKLRSISDPELWEKEGIELVDSFKKCTHVLCFRLNCEINYSKKPVILLEKYDATSLGISKHDYSGKNVIGIIKNYIPRNKEDLLLPTIKKRLHYKLLNDIYDMGGVYDDNTEIREYLPLIKMATWDLHFYSHVVHPYMEYMNDNRGTIEKKYDFFCVGHKHETNPHIAIHRVKIKEIVSSLSDKYNVIVGDGLSPNEFNKTLLASKICVAPYGIGERVATDQRAILGDCILIKPDSDNTLTYPDLYKEEYYTKCKPDLSDLKSICEKVISDIDTYKNKTTKALKLFSSVKREDFVRNLAKTVKSFG